MAAPFGAAFFCSGFSGVYCDVFVLFWVGYGS